MLHFCLFDFFRKYIKVRIFDDEEYEKNEEFYVELGEPSLTRRGSGNLIASFYYYFS